MDAADARGALRALVAERPGESLAALSRLIGRNPAYLQQFVERGSPRRLAEADRRLLARYLGVAQAVLGGPPAEEPDRVRVPRRAVRASAGPGAINDGEVVVGSFAFPTAWLRALGGRGPYSLVRAQGDSMAPGIGDGDELLVDEGDRRVTAQARPFVLRIDGMLVVKRVARAGAGLAITSDNPSAPPVAAGEVTVIGRVLWLSRALR